MQLLPRWQQAGTPSALWALPPAAVPPWCGSNCGMGRHIAPHCNRRSRVRHKRPKRQIPICGRLRSLMSRPPDVLAPIRRTACGSPNVLHLVLVGPLGAFALLAVAVALENSGCISQPEKPHISLHSNVRADRRAATWPIAVFQRDRRLDACRWPLSRIPLRPLGLDKRRLELGGTSYRVVG